jgi:hypothetical protein
MNIQQTGLRVLLALENVFLLGVTASRIRFTSGSFRFMQSESTGQSDSAWCTLFSLALGALLRGR